MFNPLFVSAWLLNTLCNFLAQSIQVNHWSFEALKSYQDNYFFFGFCTPVLLTPVSGGILTMWVLGLTCCHDSSVLQLRSGIWGISFLSINRRQNHSNVWMNSSWRNNPRMSLYTVCEVFWFIHAYSKQMQIFASNTLL